MGIGSGLASPFRRYRWLIVLALLPLGLLLAVAAAAYTLGVRAQQVSWQNGLQLTGWQRLQNGCVQAQGERLRVTRWYPLTLHVDRMILPRCAAGPFKEPAPPPWMPPLDLAIDALSLPGLPPLAVTVSQRAQRWQAQVQFRHSQARALYERRSGHWTLQGQIQAADLSPPLLGALAVAGEGVWQEQRLEGSLQAQGRQLGYAGQARRADAALSARLAARRWQLDAELGAPLALGADWSLQARQGLHASGDLQGVQSLHLDLLASGPQGKVRLELDTAGAGVAHGPGRLTLAGPALAGEVPLRWSRRQLVLLPAAIRLPGELRLSWPRPLTVPLAARGDSAITAEVQYQNLRVNTVDSRLSWQQARWDWQGRLDLAGNSAGINLAGTWQGRIDADGLSGAPARLSLSRPDLKLALRVPVAGLRPPRWAAPVAFDGRYGQFPLQGTLQVGYERERWQGTLDGRSRLPFYTQGGELKLVLPWYGQQGRWFLDRGSRVTLAKGLIGSTLVKPIAVSASTPLRVSPQGVFGELRLQADGIVATRGTLPPLDGQLSAGGLQGRASLRIPAWQATLTVSAARLAQGQKTGVQGTLELNTPLSPAMSRGLGVTLQQGRVTGQGRWQWLGSGQLQGTLSASGVALDWGGIQATGGSGSAHVELGQAGLKLVSAGPITLAELGLGTRVRNVRLTAQSDLSTWQLADVHAEVLGGQMNAASLQWPSPQYQPVTVSHIDLAEVAALQNDPEPTVQLAGRVGGVLPLQLMKDTLALQGGLIRNEGPLVLKVQPSAGVGAMGQSNRAVQLALDTLGHLAINDFQARLDMPPDGWLDAAVTIKGQNPQQNGQPVVLNYTHRENLFELLRSLRIGDELSRRVLNRKPAERSH
ncbi:intermembrane phospholipid transport protein YdbH family protein [Pseudogulbenkiania subflava]|uniref:Dicarboxylate transport n=1 Tax=Pseudogulbenkiania subflava DSM 22618 TaxID=1123014 RepID=A0A1Y6BD50_9NEIS|nr:YdbH domain-containing protein [Pseudogulbenkiania subflava]SME97548.1 Dicarboxylate transport [Pseudogulbenkiania subflava DSM 22618]